MAEEVGGIVYEVGMDVSGLKAGVSSAESALGKVDSAAQDTTKNLDKLDSQASSTGKAFSSLVSIVKNIDATLSKMASSSGQVSGAFQQTSQSAEQANQVIAALNTQIAMMQNQHAQAAASTQRLETSINATTAAIRELGQQAGSTTPQISGVERMIEGLGNQVAILEEQMENGARSAAIFAAQLRAGDGATAQQKQQIADLTGRLYDMKNGTDSAGKSTGGFRTAMQQGGYQIQDFIVQVQGGQSALVAFSQQGSQLAGAFGPSGAVIGALLALGSVVAGVLITSLNGGKNAMDALKDAAESMDKVVTVSAQGVAALSDKYALLARTNSEVATLLRNQALLEYNEAINKIPKAISDASNSLLSFGDKALSAFTGGYASIQGFNDRLESLNITTDDFSSAMKQAYAAGTAFNATTMSIGNTVGAVATKFGISEQQAFAFSKQLSDIAKNPTPEALQKLATELQNTQSATKEGQTALTAFVATLVNLSREAVVAKGNVSALKQETDNLTSGQQNLIKQSERNLALSKLQGKARARLQAQYAAEDAGFAKDDPHTKRMEDDAAATYTNTQAQKTLKSEQKKGATQAENIAQKLQKLKESSELAADSTSELSREQAILNAQTSLGKGATQAQISLAGQYAATKWDTANAIKAQAAAEKLLPEAKENAGYKQDIKDLDTALSAKKITQEQYNQTAEQLEKTHQANLAKIRAQQSVTPQQQVAGGVDPVQQLANENTQKLALITQLEQQGVIQHQQAIDLKTAADNAYKTAAINAQWEIWSQQNAATQAAAAAFDSLGSTASNALTGILTGSMSVSDAMRNIGMTVLNSVINTFVQMGIEWVKSAIMGQAAQTAAIGTVTAVQTAAVGTQTAVSTAAAATTAAAWTPAAILSSIASMGTAAAIGLGAVAGVIGTSLLGKRKNGGPVAAGGVYQVGENGLPEIFQASNGRQYMIPGDNGSVISNKDMMSGSGGASGGLVIYNNVSNYTSSNVTTTATDNGDGSVTIDTIVADIEENGPIGAAISRNYTANRRATE